MLPPDSESAYWFAEHVQPHEPMLRAWLRGRFGFQVVIDDIVQEAYVRVWKACAPGALRAPKAFLFATARNLALDHLRRHHVTRTRPLVESDLSNVLDEHNDIPETVARNQELALLTEAIQTLPDRCRQIFTLRTVSGLTQRAIAEKLGISDRTVATQLTIGVAKCTDFMLRRYEGRGPSR
jgi:RNA polymerase sigma factor (sigma-70 family)